MSGVSDDSNGGRRRTNNRGDRYSVLVQVTASPFIPLRLAARLCLTGTTVVLLRVRDAQPIRSSRRSTLNNPCGVHYYWLLFDKFVLTRTELFL